MRYVLVVEDDPVSRAFFGAALDASRVLLASDAAEAMAAAHAHAEAIAVVLIDRHLPDGDGTTVLRLLRGAGLAAPAIATSAELDESAHALLRSAGFVATLRKPAGVEEVRACVDRVLAEAPEAQWRPGRTDQGAAIVDDESALAAVGRDRAALAALRRLLVDELEQFARDLAHGGIATPDLASRLHRLRASCGFCGAPALQVEAARLQGMLGEAAADPMAVDGFLNLCRRTRDALAASAHSLVAQA